MTNSKEKIKMWLDDIRDPVRFHHEGWLWVKSYDEAVNCLNNYNVVEASLDHDLSVDKDLNVRENEKTGYHVLCYIEEYNLWPENGIKVHSQNASGREKMQLVVKHHYGKIF